MPVPAARQREVCISRFLQVSGDQDLSTPKSEWSKCSGLTNSMPEHGTACVATKTWEKSRLLEAEATWSQCRVRVGLW